MFLPNIRSEKKLWNQVFQKYIMVTNAPNPSRGDLSTPLDDAKQELMIQRVTKYPHRIHRTDFFAIYIWLIFDGKWM